MMIHGSTLYVLSESDVMNHGWLTTFDIFSPRTPVLRHVIELDNAPEALQRHDNLLLIARREAVITASLGVPTRPGKTSVPVSSSRVNPEILLMRLSKSSWARQQSVLPSLKTMERLPRKGIERVGNAGACVKIEQLGASSVS